HALHHVRRALREKNKVMGCYGSESTHTKITTGCPGGADQSAALWSRGNRRRASAAGTVRAAGWAPSTPAGAYGGACGLAAGRSRTVLGASTAGLRTGSRSRQDVRHPASAKAVCTG